MHNAQYLMLNAQCLMQNESIVFNSISSFISFLPLTPFPPLIPLIPLFPLIPLIPSLLYKQKNSKDYFRQMILAKHSIGNNLM
jgi:hypothetical protein